MNVEQIKEEAFKSELEKIALLDSNGHSQGYYDAVDKMNNFLASEQSKLKDRQALTAVRHEKEKKRNKILGGVAAGVLGTAGGIALLGHLHK